MQCHLENEQCSGKEGRARACRTRRPDDSREEGLKGVKGVRQQSIPDRGKRTMVRQQQQKDVRVRGRRRLQKNEEEEANDQQVKHDDGERRNIQRLLVDFVGRALYAGLEGCEGERGKKGKRISNNDDAGRHTSSVMPLGHAPSRLSRIEWQSTREEMRT